MTTIIAAITAIGAIVGGLVYMAKLGVWIFKKSDDQKNQAIDTSVSSEEDSVNKGGRPQW